MNRRAVALAVLSAATLLALASIAACAGDDSSSSSSSGEGSCHDDLPSSCPAVVPSYGKDVAPVVEQVCGRCHAPGGRESNRPLVTYDDLHAQRGSVLNQVHACKMPPSDGGALPAEDRKILETWLVCGAPNN